MSEAFAFHLHPSTAKPALTSRYLQIRLLGFDMQSRPRLDTSKCLWIRSGIMDQSSIFRSLRKALVERNATILTLNGPHDTEGLERIRKTVWASDAHVVMDGMMPHELGKLHAVFKDRRNFSLAL